MVRSTAHLKAVNHSIPSVYRSCHKPLQIWRSGIKHFTIYFSIFDNFKCFDIFQRFYGIEINLFRFSGMENTFSTLVLYEIPHRDAVRPRRDA